MNREIKFRAWDEQNMEMHYPKTAAENFGHGGSTSGDILKHYSVVMQGTGVIDKHGKEIYEGDIVDSWAHLENAQPYFREVVWDNCGLEFKPRTGFILTSNMDGKFEVIGNIYENPELLNPAP